MIAACHEHLERAIDEFIDKYQSSPDMFRRDQLSQEETDVPDKCGYCAEPAVYLVKEYAD